MKEIKDPVKEVNRLSVLMLIYFVLYIAAVILAIIAMSVGSGIPLIIIAVLCAVTAIALDIYVRAARARLNNRLNSEFKAAGINISEMEKQRKRVHK